MEANATATSEQGGEDTQVSSYQRNQEATLLPSWDCCPTTDPPGAEEHGLIYQDGSFWLACLRSDTGSY